jgi:hypothetical protein
MKISARTIQRREDEHGYVAVVTALIVTVLLLAVGLVVDLAYWYSRSSTAPKLSDEITLAQQSLANNGLVNGKDGIQVDVVNLPGYANRLQVTVRDTDVSGFFTRLFRRSPSIERSSTAQYIQNISLGSALNALGTGPETGFMPWNGVGPQPTQNFWLSVSGYCTAKEDGDRLLSSSDGNRKEASYLYACNQWSNPHPDLTNAHLNTEYDPSGYTYFVTVPCSTGLTECDAETTTDDIVIEAYDPAYNPNGGTNDPTDLRIDRKAVANSQHWAWYYSEVNTTYSLYKPDATPENLTDDEDDHLSGSPVKFWPCGGSCPGQLSWYPLATIPAGSPKGRYRVQVHTQTQNWYSYGHNMFALRARVGNTFTLCSTIPGQVGYTAGAMCPSVAGDESMSVYASKEPNGTELQADMYLARLAPADEYRGKRIRVLLWDPGEGAESIQILAPGTTATPVEFRHRTWDPGISRTDGTLLEDKAEGWDTKLLTDTLNVSATTPLVATVDGVLYPQWDLPSRYSQFKYNDRMVALEFTVPKTYGRDNSGNSIPLPDDGWWKIRYKSSTGLVQDRTTWSVTLAGDPVHLVKPD